MTINSIPSASVQAKAQQLLHERHLWAYVRNKETGISFIAIPSGDHVYQVRPDGRGCSCKAAQLGNLVCSHRLAVSTVAHRAALDALVSDGWEPIPPHEQRQAEAWVAECRAAPDAARRPAGDEMWPENQDAF